MNVALGAAVLALVIVATPARGADPLPSPGALRDPWVPPGTIKSMPAHRDDVPLRTQVERKLRASFDAADVEGRGAITREQARRAGLGIVADNFERIDRSGAGRVTFDDFRQYLRDGGADL